MDQPDTVSIIVNPDGSLEYLHVDWLGAELGEREVRRASDVEFDPYTQEWFATLMDGREIARHPLRNEVLRQERQVIEAMLVAGEPIPTGPDTPTNP